MERLWDYEYDKEIQQRRELQNRKPLSGEEVANWLFGHDGECVDVLPSKGSNARLSSTNYYFVNGILNTFSMAESSAKSIADMLGVKVTLVYSRTEGIKTDIEKAFKIHAQKLLTPATRQVIQLLSNDLRRGKKVVVMAHSRGAAVVRMAVEYLQLTSKVNQEKLTVVTFGGFGFPAEDWYTHATVISFINDDGFESDPIPKVYDPLLMPSAPNLKIHLFENYLGWIRIYQKLEAKHFSGKITIRTYFLQDFPDL